MRALLFLLCCWVGAAQAAEPVLLQVGGMVQNQLTLTGKERLALPQLPLTFGNA